MLPHREQIDLLELDASLGESAEWVEDYMSRIDFDNAYLAFEAMKAALRQIRDDLSIPEALELARRMPALIRGYFLEDWEPGTARDRENAVVMSVKPDERGTDLWIEALAGVIRERTAGAIPLHRVVSNGSAIQ